MRPNTGPTSTGPQREAEQFSARYAGRLQEIAAAPDASARLGAAVLAFEELEDVLGRIMSYASLRYTENTADPQRAKFYADAQDRVTAISSNLLFFPLEAQPRRRGGARPGRVVGAAGPLSAVAGRPCARTGRISSRPSSNSCSTRNP